MIGGRAGTTAGRGAGPREGRAVWPRLAIFAAIALVYLSGALDFLELRLADLRFRLLEREASGSVTVVAIDGASIQRLGYWPWPRSAHAQLLDRLRAAGAADVTFDIDFSSRSDEAEDASLEAALERWGGRASLAAFRQPTRTEGQFVYSEPLPRLRRQSQMVSVNVRPDADGAVRRLQSGATASDGSTIPSLGARLSDVPLQALPAVFYIDYAIDPGSVPQISYSDVVAGRFDPASVEGKHVVVGATAIELGDIVAVPVHQAMPGVLVQAVAAESIIQGRMLQAPAHALTIALLGALVFLLAPWLDRLSWQRGMAATVSVIAGSNLAGLGIQAAFPVLPPVLPYALAAVALYASTVIGRVDRLSLGLLAQRLVLDRQSRLMRAIVDNSFDALVTTDEAGRILSFNPAAERLFGQAASSVYGTPLGALLRPETERDQADLSGAGLLDSIFRAGQSREALACRLDGGSITVDVAVSRTADSETSIYIALIRDVSARKAAETLASQARHRLLDAIESLSEGFALYDAEDRLVQCNLNYQRQFANVAELLKPGWHFEDIVRAHVGTGDVPAALDDPEGWIEEILRRHRDPQGAYEMLTADQRWLRLSERRTIEGGVAVMVSDMTEVKERENELRHARDVAELASRSKSEFLANMSHELRTPLNAIIGFADIMETQLFGPLGHENYRTYARDIRGSGEHLLSVITDILDMARVESGKLTLNEEIVDLAAVTDGAIRLIRQRAEAAGLTATSSVGPGLPDLIADARLVKQCLINLLSNAVKFTPSGGRVDLDASIRPDGALELRVVDTGIGIAAEDMERVMLPFGQVESDLDRRFEGTGLGLPLVKSYVELHGGNLRIESEVGKGTVASLVFPAERLREPMRSAARQNG